MTGARVPASHPVRPLRRGSKAYNAAEARGDLCTCGTCGRSWDDGQPTSYTPAPSGRCPFEYYHKAEVERPQPPGGKGKPLGWRVSASSRNFDFEGVGATREEAEAALTRALAEHARDYGLAPDWHEDSTVLGEREAQALYRGGWRDGARICD